jgi:CPA2 family monovalent cation:H+ antiporter-2/glutathione-regulated potassium-efflux system protein KefB
MSAGVSVTAIDTDVELIDTAGEFGMQVYFGEGTRLDMLRQAGAGDAQLILFCLDGDQLEKEFLEAVHDAFPQASIFLRVFDRRSVIRLVGSPVQGMVREVFGSAIAMARLGLDNLGVSEGAIDEAEEIYRGIDHERLRRQKEAGDLYAAREVIVTRPRVLERGAGERDESATTGGVGM